MGHFTADPSTNAPLSGALAAMPLDSTDVSLEGRRVCFTPVLVPHALLARCAFDPSSRVHESTACARTGSLRACCASEVFC
jgi:hypothetical protein